MLTLKDLGLRARQAPVTARLTTKSTQIWGQSQVYRFLKQERNTLRVPPGKGVSGHTRVFRAAQVAGKWWGAVCTWSHRPRPGDRSSCHSQRLLFPRVVPARRAAGQPAERAGSGYNSSHQGAAADMGDRLNKHGSPLLIPMVRLKQARVCASLCCSWCVHGAGWSLCR